MSAVKAFFDTNVLLYLLAGGSKADAAEELISHGGTISVQVLNEIASVATRKLKMPWPDINEFLVTIRRICDVKPLTVEVHTTGLEIAERFGLSVYDGFIIAAAKIAGCDILYSEDMQDGQSVNGVKIKNPFK